MNANVGKTDKLVRIGIAAVAVLLALAVGVGSVGGIVAIAVAVIAAVTAAVGFCPLYRLLGINTCKVPAAK